MSFLWEHINKLWDQDIILREQNNILFSHGLNQPPYKGKSTNENINYIMGFG